MVKFEKKKLCDFKGRIVHMALALLWLPLAPPSGGPGERGYPRWVRHDGVQQPTADFTYDRFQVSCLGAA